MNLKSLLAFDQLTQKQCIVSLNNGEQLVKKEFAIDDLKGYSTCPLAISLVKLIEQ